MQTVNLTFGIYTNLDGTPATRRIRITTPTPLLDTRTGNIVFRDVDVPGRTDYTISLPATDDTDISPKGFTYQIQLDNEPVKSVSLPKNIPVADFDLLAPVTINGGTAWYPPTSQGIPGKPGPRGQRGLQGPPGPSTAAAQNAAAAALADRIATEAARDVALARVDVLEAPAKAVLDDIMGGDVAQLVPDVAGKVDRTRLPVNVKDHGAQGDGTTDDTAAINAAISLASSQNRGLLFPATATVTDGQVGYKLTSPLVIPARMSVNMEAPLLWSSTTKQPAITVGDAATRNLFVELCLWVKWDAAALGESTWTDENEIGIRSYNLENSKLRIEGVRGFTTGVELIGKTYGWVHNETSIGQIYGCRYGMRLRAATGGWVNENAFNGGSWANNSGLKPTLSRYAVIIESDVGEYLNNGNVFYKPSFEIGLSVTGGTDCTPVVVRHGHMNAFLDARMEVSGPVAMRTENKSKHNKIGLALSIGQNLPPNGLITVKDTGSVPSSTFESLETNVFTTSNRPVLVINNLADLATVYGTGNKVMVPGLNSIDYGSGAPSMFSGGGTCYTTHLELSTIGILGITVNTENVKSFYLTRDAVDGLGGRAWVTCYDAAGAQLDTAVGGPHVIGGTNWMVSTTFGNGAYRTVADSTRSYFTVTDAVKSVFVGVNGGTSNAKLRGFGLYTSNNDAPSTVNRFPESALDRMAVSAPASGTWRKGIRVYNATPNGGNGYGWVCTSAGTPGTWTAF